MLGEHQEGGHSKGKVTSQKIPCLQSPPFLLLKFGQGQQVDWIVRERPFLQVPCPQDIQGKNHLFELYPETDRQLAQQRANRIPVISPTVVGLPHFDSTEVYEPFSKTALHGTHNSKLTWMLSEYGSQANNSFGRKLQFTNQLELLKHAICNGIGLSLQPQARIQ